MYRYMPYVFCVVLMSCLCLNAEAETLSYNISWQSIPAGTATLKFVENGDRVQVILNARSLSVMDAIYPVRTHVESEILASSGLPKRYFKRSKEGWGEEKTGEVVFDRERLVADVYKNGRPKRTLAIPPDVHDPISCLYFYRKLPNLSEGPVHLALTDGKRVSTGVATVLGKETIETPAGRFQTILVEPKMEGLTGVFQKSPNARILVWLTDDKRRLPVRLKSEVIVGAFTAQVTAIE